MRRALAVVVVSLAINIVTATAAVPEFRLVAIDAAMLPEIRALVDSRTDAGGPKELTAKDFQIVDGELRESGHRSLKFRDTATPLALVVVIDLSPSMRGKPIEAVRQGVAKLVSRRRQDDRTAILSFADDLQWEARWDATDGDKERVLRNLQTRGNRTRLYDAVWQATDELAEQSRRDETFPSRQTILVMSDGHDEGSGNTLDQLAARLRPSRVRVDAVGLARSPVWLKNLRAIAHAGFGEFGSTDTSEGLTALLERGIDRVLDAPLLEFKADSFDADGKLHTVAIKHIPTGWQQEMDVRFPAPSLFARPTTWLAGLTVVLAVGGIGLVARRWRRGADASPVPGLAPAPSSGRQPPPPDTLPKKTPRAPTIVEPSRESVSSTDTSRPDHLEPSTSPPPRRAPTMVIPPAAERAAALVAVGGPYASQRFPLSDGEFWIGSSINNHLVLSADPSVSGNHACIRSQEQFHRVYDNGSLNGTYVNDRRIDREPVLIRAGDRIRIGQTSFTVTL